MLPLCVSSLRQRGSPSKHSHSFPLLSPFFHPSASLHDCLTAWIACSAAPLAGMLSVYLPASLWMHFLDGLLRSALSLLLRRARQCLCDSHTQPTNLRLLPPSYIIFLAVAHGNLEGLHGLLQSSHSLTHRAVPGCLIRRQLYGLLCPLHCKGCHHSQASSSTSIAPTRRLSLREYRHLDGHSLHPSHGASSVALFLSPSLSLSLSHSLTHFCSLLLCCF